MSRSVATSRVVRTRPCWAAATAIVAADFSIATLGIAFSYIRGGNVGGGGGSGTASSTEAVPQYLRWLHRAHVAVAPLRPRAFAEIFAADSWNAPGAPAAVDQATRAGPGSTVRYTAKVRAFLGSFFRNYNITRVADMSCSELLWQPLIPGFGDLELFAGFDIVPGAVERARMRIADLRAAGAQLPRRVELETMDLVTDRLSGAFDLVIVRDTLFHLPPTDALVALEHISASGSRFLGTTTIDIETIRNSFILPGEWYALNLRKPPFLFPAPLNSTIEGEPGADYFGSKMFGVWPLPLMMDHLAHSLLH